MTTTFLLNIYNVNETSEYEPYYTQEINWMGYTMRLQVWKEGEDDLGVGMESYPVAPVGFIINFRCTFRLIPVLSEHKVLCQRRRRQLTADMRQGEWRWSAGIMFKNTVGPNSGDKYVCDDGVILQLSLTVAARGRSWTNEELTTEECWEEEYNSYDTVRSTDSIILEYTKERKISHEAERKRKESGMEDILEDELLDEKPNRIGRLDSFPEEQDKVTGRGLYQLRHEVKEMKKMLESVVRNQEKIMMQMQDLKHNLHSTNTWSTRVNCGT